MRSRYLSESCMAEFHGTLTARFTGPAALPRSKKTADTNFYTTRWRYPERFTVPSHVGP
jgi:hypothetical protein